MTKTLLLQSKPGSWIWLHTKQARRHKFNTISKPLSSESVELSLLFSEEWSLLNKVYLDAAMINNQKKRQIIYIYEGKRLERLCAASLRPSTLFSFYTSRIMCCARHIRGFIWLANAPLPHYYIFNKLFENARMRRPRWRCKHMHGLNCIGVNLIRNLPVLCRCMPCAWYPSPPA